MKYVSEKTVLREMVSVGDCYDSTKEFNQNLVTQLASNPKMIELLRARFAMRWSQKDKKQMRLQGKRSVRRRVLLMKMQMVKQHKTSWPAWSTQKIKWKAKVRPQIKWNADSEFLTMNN